MLLVAGTGPASGGSVGESAEGSIGTLEQPRPAWLTDQLEAQIVAAGPQGVASPPTDARRAAPNPLGI